MLHPVGSQPPAVYWRRRLLAAAASVLVIVLLVLTVNALSPGGGGTPAAAGPEPGHSPLTTPPATSPHSTPAQHDTPASQATSPAHTGTAQTGTTQTRHGTGAPASGDAVVPPACSAGQLSVKAVVGAATYQVGDEPVLTLQVTNSGPAACVQNVADSQILLRVYNGSSRVWGSHDCKIAPGADPRTLRVDKPAGFSIVWSGLTSRPKCAGTRQRVGAGTYTLYATLSGHDGKATRFTIS